MTLKYNNLLRPGQVTMATIVDRLTFIFELEKERIVSRGILNNIIGWGTLIIIYTLIPPFIKSIWPTDITYPFLFYLITTTFIICLSTPLFLLIYLPGYLNWTSAYQKYRIQPTISRPWQRPDWPQTLRRWAKFWFFNKFVVNPLYLIVLSQFVTVSYQYDLESFPTPLQLIKTIICVMFVDDFFYWASHKMFHESKTLYKFHKIHHQYDSPFCMIGEYCHPIEQIFANLLSATFAFLLVKAHMFVIFFWMTYKTFTSSQGHSGYEFPWSFSRVVPFVYSGRYHDFHHSRNVGNFATSLYIIETLFGTNDTFFQEEFKAGRIKTRLRKSKTN